MILWELGKYLCIVLVVGSLIFNKRIKISGVAVVMIALLIPSLGITFLTPLLEEYPLRKQILFNLSGPLLLCLTTMVFFQSNFRFTKSEMAKILRVALLPGLTVLALLFGYKSIANIEFGTTSLADASGGFGPNQVSTALGVYGAITIYALFSKIVLWKYKLIDVAFLLLVIFRGFLTFSRGGMVGMIAALLAAIIFTFIINGDFRSRFRPKHMIGIFTFVFLAGGTILYINYLSNNFLYYRYMGYESRDIILAERRGVDPSQLESNTMHLSNRDDVVKYESTIFSLNGYMGSGIGLSMYYKRVLFNFNTAAHTEYSRLLAEHGVLGILFGLLIFLVPFGYYIKHPTSISPFWFILVISLSVLTMAHSAMRLSLVPVLYGISFLKILPDEES